ncbi:MAG: long-chain fatty acid--CoA ligase [Alphaproteobacteria bacterium]
MHATMMDYPLTLVPLLERAGKLFPDTEIVSRRPDKSLHRYRTADFCRRARALAAALQRAGLAKGEAVATLMWNNSAHLEAYFGVPCAGGVVLTLNLRLPPADLTYIVNHAKPRFLIIDDVLLPLYEQFKKDVALDRVFVVRWNKGSLADGLSDYDSFIEPGSDGFVYPALAEGDAAGMCYTSGTTGKPKGVVYSHRALVLHSLAISLPDVHAFSHRECVMPVVPMFHANAWGHPFACVMLGAKQVFPGPHLDAESLLDLCANEGVTLTAGVPTVWLAVVQALDANPTRWRLKPGMRVLTGGSAAPEGLLRGLERHGLKAMHGWGMTEMAPVGALYSRKLKLDALDTDARYRHLTRQGLPLPLVEMRVVNDAGEAPWDGESMGELQVRGPFIAGRYHNAPEAADRWTGDGWFKTGDVVTIDADGYMKLADRTKDLVKSGGEWISSVELENALMSHPAVAEAAVIAIQHPKWQERPLAAVVLKKDAQATAESLRAHLAERFAKWWLPDAIVFIDAIPRTSTGKFQKAVLRERFKDWQWDKAV